YKLMRGKAEGSFGIEVAKMAGLPQKVIKRAEEILSEYQVPLLEKVYIQSVHLEKEHKWEEILQRIESIDIANTTPLQALLILSELKERVKAFKEKENLLNL
ncbi:MAG: MutS-related protein, partial [Hydrogenobacter sp.]